MRKALEKYRVWYPPDMPSPECPIRGAARFFPELTEPSYDMHFPLEVGIVVRGELERYFEAEKRKAGPGQVWFCGVWEPHGCRVSQAPCEMVFLLVYPPMLAGVWFEEAPPFNWMAPFTAPPADRPQFPPARKARALALAQALKDALAGEGVRARLRLRVLLLELLIEAGEGWEPPAGGGTDSARSFARIGNALELVFRGGKFVTEEEAASACNTNPKTFARLFKRLMGIPFPRFALRYRLGNAARELVQTGAAIKAVAAHWGFSDLSHFYRCFKSHYACTPAEFRRERV
ncbi:MAG: helix-turn-helix transcriptional regulator [Kiritimatiellae bacterium]|nr:helix-turn-helix transcriptional regulator [Kiritimatiellia bacterium]